MNGSLFKKVFLLKHGFVIQDLLTFYVNSPIITKKALIRSREAEKNTLIDNRYLYLPLMELVYPLLAYL